VKTLTVVFSFFAIQDLQLHSHSFCFAAISMQIFVVHRG